MEKAIEFLKKLTFDDLRSWATDKIVSRGKSYVANVHELSRTNDGALTAWVSGSEEYATSVGPDPDGEIEYVCTCPYIFGPCKHTVAVVLAAADAVKRKREIPLLDEGSGLFLALFDDYEEDDPDGEDDEELSEPTKREGAAKDKGETQIRNILKKMSKEALTAMLIGLISKYPEIERAVVEREQLATGRIDEIVSSLHSEIRDLTAEPTWFNHWDSEEDLPDFSHVREQFQALLTMGHADALLQLGEELWTLGSEQSSESNDEGETGSAIAECMEVVLQAITQTSLTSPEQLLWVIDRDLADEYSLLGSAGIVLDSSTYTPAHWVEVADVLAARLNSTAKPASADTSDTYRRRKLLYTLLNAHNRSSRPEKIIPLLEKEAEGCQCYEELVDALLFAGERAKARQWCILGFNRTTESARGIATNLQKRLREMAVTEMNYHLVAAYRAQDFLDSPSCKGYEELRQASEKTELWLQIREGVLRYLTTGRRPDAGGHGDETTAWPLAPPEVIRPRDTMRRHERFPNLEMLIDIAILEKRFDDVIALHEELRKTKRCEEGTDKAVAQAIAETHPQVALDIWRPIVDNLIAQVKPKAYEEAAVYLRSMYKVYQESLRLTDWRDLLCELRRVHKAKRRLMEVLDTLGRNILD